MAEMDKIFKAAMDFKASDIHLSPGEPYIFRLFGKLRKVKSEGLTRILYYPVAFSSS